MTYCVGIKLDSGLVLASDSRTNAGVDHIATFRKTGSSLKKFVNRIPRKVIEDTVKNMLPKGLRLTIPKRLRIYDYSEHPHLAQNPVLFEG